MEKIHGFKVINADRKEFIYFYPVIH